MHLWKGGKRIAQRGQVPWPCCLERDARNNTLNVGPVANDGADGFRIRCYCHAGFESLDDRGTIAQWMVQPLAQLPRAHVGCGVIQKRKKRRRRFAGNGFGNFQIPARRRIHADEIIMAFDAEPNDVRQYSPLRLLHILKQRTCRRDRHRHVHTAKTLEITCPELLCE